MSQSSHPNSPSPSNVVSTYQAAPRLMPEERQALSALAQQGAWCRRVGSTWIVVARQKGVSLRIASLHAHVHETFVRRKWIAADTKKEAFFITPAGRKMLQRRLQPVDFQAASHDFAVTETDTKTPLLINRDESALSRLARLKKPDGSPFIDAAGIASGERLAADIMRAGMVPGVTMRWDATGSAGDHRMNPTDLMLAARQRVEAALDTVGHEFAGLLIDVLAFSKGLEEIERERRWPQRSAKIIIAMALDRLAGHYGYSAVARGADHVRSRVWQADDARPRM